MPTTGKSTRRGFVVLAFALLALALLVMPHAAAAEPSAGATCAAIARVDFSGLTDAPTQITATQFVPATAAVPAHCNIIGYVATHIGFELDLPVSNWNGKFLQIGCGGFCGSVSREACDNVLPRGYACLATDLGHKSTALDAKWAYNDLQTEIDFAYRATHVVTLAGKAITQRFFGAAPARSYFLGCSTGGRQGLVEAERFPWDYDGIVAGAPVIDETGDAMAVMWNIVSARDATGAAILTPEDAQLVHTAVVARCDRDDGVEDGLIGDPRRCGFDPSSLLCAAGEASHCLTPEKVAAVKKIYGGPVDSHGNALYTSGALPGSELNWIGNYIPAIGAAHGMKPLYEPFMTDFFAYLAFLPAAGPGWKLGDFDWDHDYRRLGLMESLYTGSNPDLRKFKAQGGKLILYQGWADHSVLPLNVIDFYETAERTMGGHAATQAFMRLYMVPGMDHCIGGEGAYAIDYLSNLEAWVESGKAPDVLHSVHPKRTDLSRSWWGLPLPAAEEVGFARPVYPYPLETHYRGRGDPKDEASYAPFPPRSPP